MAVYGCTLLHKIYSQMYMCIVMQSDSEYTILSRKISFTFVKTDSMCPSPKRYIASTDIPVVPKACVPKGGSP